MYIDYYNLPFGAQLLLWTSRIALLANCRASPNKYEVINIAFKRAVFFSNPSCHLLNIIKILGSTKIVHVTF